MPVSNAAKFTISKASGHSVTEPEPLETRIAQCRDHMSAICSGLLQELQQQPEELKKLLPHLRQLYQTYGRIIKLFPIELERDLGHQASMLALVTASGDILSRLLVLMDQVFKARPAGHLDSEPVEAAALSVLLSSFHNFSDCSVEFVRALAASETFCRGCYLQVTTAWVPIFLEGRLSNEACKDLRRLMDIVYNCYFKMDTETDAHLAAYDFVEPVKPLLQSQDERMSFSALLLVCFALDESKAEYYLGQQKSISLLIRTLNSAIENDRRRCLGYHAIELAKCVNRLALNDVNKELLVELELLPVLHRLLDGGRTDEISAALNILFTLSFSATARSRVRREFESQLASLTSQPDWSGHAALQGLVFALAEADDAPSASAKGKAAARSTSAASRRLDATIPNDVKRGGGGGGGCDFNVMMSYQHESRETVAQIRDQLRLHGIKVWIDYEQMTDGSTLSAMADAVENSTMVIICMSRRYKDSNNCRLEAEYAWRNGKRMLPLLMERGYRPNGWLGLILGAGLYHDFSGKYPFEAKLAELLALVRRNLQDGPGEEEAGHHQPSSRPASAAGRQQRGEHAMPTAVPLPPIAAVAGAGRRAPATARTWSAAEVQKWLAGRGLRQLPGQRLTGVALQALVTMRQRAPEAFYAAVQRHYPFGDFAEMAEFVEALEDL